MNASARVFYISSPFPAKQRRLIINSRFFVERGHMTVNKIFLSLFELESRPYEFSSLTIQSHKTN